MSCQLRLPLAKSPKAFMNSCRAARKGLPSGWAGGALSGPCDALTRPDRSAMIRERRQTTRSAMRRMGTSGQGPEGVGDADTRMPREAASYPPRHAHRENRENERPTDDFEQRTRGAEEGARLNQRDPTLRDLRPQTHDQVQEEHLHAHPERVGNEVVRERRGAPEGREPEEEHSATANPFTIGGIQVVKLVMNASRNATSVNLRRNLAAISSRLSRRSAQIAPETANSRPASSMKSCWATGRSRGRQRRAASR